jgi:hypothetical protein
MLGLCAPLVDGGLIVLGEDGLIVLGEDGLIVLGEDGLIVLGEDDGLVLDWACANPAMPRAAVSATAAVSVRFIGVLPLVKTGRARPLPTNTPPTCSRF